MATANNANMDTPPDTTPAPLPEFDLGDGRTVHSYEDGALYRVRMPNGEIQGFRPKVEATPENALDDIVTNPPAPEPGVVVLTPLTILGRLTQTEEAALASSTDLAVAIVRNRLIAASEVRSDDPRTAEGRAILGAKGILTAERAAEIFA